MTASVRRANAWRLPMMTLGLMAGILIGRSASSLWPGLIALALTMLAAPLTRGRSRVVMLAVLMAAIGCLAVYRA